MTNSNISAKHNDIEDLDISVEQLKVIQDKAIEYVESLNFDSVKEEGVAYSSFVSACKYMLS